MTVLRGSRVLIGELFRSAELAVSQGVFVEAVEGEPIELGARVVLPGIVDLQINGGWGHDFTADPSSIWEVGRRLPELGVTSFLPTIVTAPYEKSAVAIGEVAAGPPPGYLGADVLGLHIEGPWISPHWKGAHQPGHLRLPDPQVARYWAESGVVRMVTMAPELEGAWAAAEVLADAGVVVSAGHSGADFETGAKALAGPWSMVTHLFNQMSPFQHRDPGLVGAALASGRPCGLIVDGLHSHPGTVAAVWQALGSDRVVLVSDAMAALGLGPGLYPLGEIIVQVGDDGPRLGDGRLAGSVLRPLDGVANLARWADVDPEVAQRCATTTPARVVGLEDRGSLEPGQRADLVVVEEGRVVMTMVAGEIVHRTEG